jgi:hypothetical protein
MRSAKDTGRIVGILSFFQLAGVIVPFVLLLPVARGASAFLENAAGVSAQIKLAVFLLFANCAITIGISFAAAPVFRRYSDRLALFLVLVSVIMFSLQAVDNAHLLSMISVSQQYLQTPGQSEIFEALGATVYSTRRWVHFSEILVIDVWFFAFYAILYRFALVPRILAGLGLLTVVLHFTGITLPWFLGYGMITLMGASMALSHFALAVWLIAKGFVEREHAEEPEG